MSGELTLGELKQWAEQQGASDDTVLFLAGIGISFAHGQLAYSRNDGNGHETLALYLKVIVPA